MIPRRFSQHFRPGSGRRQVSHKFQVAFTFQKRKQKTHTYMNIYICISYQSTFSNWASSSQSSSASTFGSCRMMKWEHMLHPIRTYVCFTLSTLMGIIIPTDTNIFSEGLKPPTNYWRIVDTCMYIHWYYIYIYICWGVPNFHSSVLWRRKGCRGWFLWQSISLSKGSKG